MLGTPILVSGASGFIGRRLLARLRAEGRQAGGLYRRPPAGQTLAPLDRLGDLTDPATLHAACAGFEAIIHCAGHAHAFGESPERARLRHDAVNLQGTRALLQAAQAAGVRRFVFLSSVKAAGHPGDALADESWPLPPETEYGRAKRAAEQAVLEAGARVCMRVCCVRPVMVYGRGGRGNLERMARGIRAGWFPPLPETGALRSMVHVDDLVEAVLTVLDDLGGEGRADGRRFIVAHAGAVSGAALYDALRAALRLPPVRWRVPAAALQALGGLGSMLSQLLGRPLPLDREVVDRLLGPEQWSAAEIGQQLDWQARVDLADGLAEMLGGAASVDVRGE